MRNAKRVGRRYIFGLSQLGVLGQWRPSTKRAIVNSAAGVVAAGLLQFALPHAQANISLFTTQDDFALDPNSDGMGGTTDYGNAGWTGQNGATIAPSGAYDSDGSTVNGVGNLTNPGGTGTAGSLSVAYSASQTNFNYVPFALCPGNDRSNQSFMSALDPGSTAAYTAASSYGAGTTTAYSGTLDFTYTMPTISSGSYLAGVIYLNGLQGGYQNFQATSTVNDGTVDGLSTYTASIPYTIQAGSFTYLQLGLQFGTNDTFTSPFYVDALQVVTASAAGASQWIVNGNGAYETDANWSNGEPKTAGSSAVFDTDGGTITVSPTVTLSSPVTVDSITFNASTISYTIANGGAGNITTNTINVLAGSHTINAGLTVKNGAVFTINSGAALTASNVVDGVGYYHTVEVTGGGSLTVNNLNNAALDVNNATLTTTGTNTGQFVYLEHNAVWNIDATSTIEQYYDDASTTLNLAPGITLFTEFHTSQIGGQLTGSGNLSLGGGPNGIDSGDGYATALNGNNSNYSGAVTITGTGTLSISADDNLGNGSATNTLNISNGTLNLNGAVVGTHGLIIGSGNGAITTGGFNMQVGSLSGPGTLSLSGGNTLTVAPQVVGANSSGGVRALTLGGLNLNSTNVSLATATLQANRTALVIGSGGLSLSGSSSAWSSLLDLGGNDLIVRGGTLATIANQVAEGYAGGTWQASGGIASAAAAANTTHLTALGVIQNSANGSPSGTVLHSTVDGVASTDADVLVKYTYYGDANLDGKVDGSDYSRIDSGYVTHATGWYNGDFNYDGVVNGSDYTLIDNAFNTQGASLSAELAAPDAVATAEIAGAGSSAVPEPTTLGLLGIGAASLLGRRSKRRHR